METVKTPGMKSYSPDDHAMSKENVMTQSRANVAPAIAAVKTGQNFAFLAAIVPTMASGARGHKGVYANTAMMELCHGLDQKAFSSQQNAMKVQPQAANPAIAPVKERSTYWPSFSTALLDYGTHMVLSTR